MIWLEEATESVRESVRSLPKNSTWFGTKQKKTHFNLLVIPASLKPMGEQLRMLQRALKASVKVTKACNRDITMMLRERAKG